MTNNIILERLIGEFCGYSPSSSLSSESSKYTQIMGIVKKAINSVVFPGPQNQRRGSYILDSAPGSNTAKPPNRIGNVINGETQFRRVSIVAQQDQEESGDALDLKHNICSVLGNIKVQKPNDYTREDFLKVIYLFSEKCTKATEEKNLFEEKGGSLGNFFHLQENVDEIFRTLRNLKKECWLKYLDEMPHEQILEIMQKDNINEPLIICLAAYLAASIESYSRGASSFSDLLDLLAINKTDNCASDLLKFLADNIRFIEDSNIKKQNNDPSFEKDCALIRSFFLTTQDTYRKKAGIVFLHQDNSIL